LVRGCDKGTVGSTLNARTQTAVRHEAVLMVLTYAVRVEAWWGRGGF
jgi:hypothetical protein